MISLFVLQLSRKMLFFIHKGIDFEVTLWRHRRRHHHGNIFFFHNLGDLSISDIKLQLCLILWHFQNDHHFGIAKKLFIESDSLKWICQKDSHENLWNFELFIDALAQILTELLQFKMLTYIETRWRYQSITACKGVFTIQCYICSYTKFKDIFVNSSVITKNVIFFFIHKGM